MNERLAITQRVMKAMRHESARRPLEERNAEGAVQVVVCLNTDTVEYAAKRVQAVGGKATVVLPHRNALVPLGWTLGPSSNECGRDDGPIHPDSTLGMLVEYFEAAGLTHCTYRISPEMGAVDVSEGEQLTVPA